MREPDLNRPRSVPTILLWTIVLAVGFILMSCGPKIHDFTVWPRRACPDDTVRIWFDVRGDAQLEVVKRSSSGVDTTTYMLVVERNGKTEIARQDVIRWTSPPTKELVFRTTTLGNDSLHVVESLSEANWKSGLVLGTIASESGRAIHIRHGGREVLLDADGRPSNTFEGLPVYGSWELKAALLPGEVMGNPQHPPPDRLRIKATMLCNQKGATP